MGSRASKLLATLTREMLPISLLRAQLPALGLVQLAATTQRPCAKRVWINGLLNASAFKNGEHL